ncbi:MAG: PD40 domain-containing protein [Candidatus Aminicenantes bacterium]|nr:PD40 domain-containing protein [Candidatus Aminicenantes bacterium]
MKKISFFLLAMCITLAIVLAVEPTSAWFEALPPANSAEDADKLAEGHFGKAIRLLKQENFQDAIAEYNKVIKLLPKSKIAQDAQYWIGQSYFRMGQLDEALSIFEKLIKDYPGSAIIPVAQMMMARVQKEKENEKSRAKRDATSDKKVIIDPKTGAKYHKIGSLTGKKDVIDHTFALKLSPNNKFLLYENLVIPLNEEEPFNLVDMDAWRGIWSPDGKKVAFYTKEGPIWIVPVSPETGKATGPPEKLLDIKFGWQGPVSWSPDSEKIVFSGTEGEYQGNIWTISVEDGALTQVTDDPIWEGNPICSPDGKTIAYNKSRSEIWAVSTEGGKPRKIIDVGRGGPVSWSPDSNWILYSAPGFKYRLFRFADERVFDIDLPNEVGSFFSWSQDGKKMLFYRSSYEYSCVLRVVSTSGGPSFELGRELKLWPYVHHWSPDSKMIITTGGYPIEPKFKNDLAFWMVPLAGGEARPIEPDVSGVSKPQPRSLSHDCKRLLLFEKQSEGKEDLYVVPVSLKDARPTGPAIMVFKERDKKPVGYGRRDECAWSSDGKKLAVVHGGDIWITSADKGEPVNITNSPEHETFPVWSPDGKMIAYTVRYDEKGGDEQSLHIIPASGGKAKKILDTSDKELHAWSPDGKELAVISDGKILAIPISGGKAREIFDLEEFIIKRVQSLSWLPDGKHFAFIGEKEKEYGIGNRIYLISEKGDKIIELAADDDNWKDWLYPSPDGKWISYDSEGEVKVRSEGTIWEVDMKELLSKGKKEQKK